MSRLDDNDVVDDDDDDGGGGGGYSDGFTRCLKSFGALQTSRRESRSKFSEVDVLVMTY